MNDVKTVLLVDSDLARTVAHGERLQEEGFNVQTAEDGGEALFHLASLPIDVVVLDLILPTFSGSEVFKRMRADERLKDLPVVILSDAAAQKRPTDLGGPTQLLLKSETQFPALLQAIWNVLQIAETNGSSAASGDTNFSQRTNNTVLLNAASQTLVATSTSKKTSAAKKAPEFFEALAAELPKIRENCFAYLKAPNTPAGQKQLTVLRDRLTALDASSKAAECARISLLTKPFQALLSGLLAKATDPSPSIHQTIAQALDCLALIVESGKAEAFEPMLKPQALVVDDDPISNEVNTTALQQADFDVTGIEDPFTALELLAGTPFDLIVLDVNMPKLTGFEVCEKLRQLPGNEITPVLFLTAFSNFENRKKSVLSGGGDFITKPVSTRELALKGAIHLLKALIRVPQAKTVRRTENPSSGVAQHPLSASALISLTESATSGSVNSDCLTIAPSWLNPAAVEAPTVKNRVAPEPDSNRIPPVRNGKAHTEKAAGSQTPKADEVKRNSAPTEDLISTEPSTLRDMHANSETERPVNERARNGEMSLNHTRVPIEAADVVSKDQAALQEKIAQCKDLEQQLAELLRSREELHSNVANREVAALNSQKELQELKEQLSQRSTELESLKADFTRQSADHIQSEAEIRELLNVAQAAALKAEATAKEKDDNYRLLEDELIPLRKVRDQLQQKQQQTAAELVRVKAGLAQETAERAKSESELRAQLNGATLAASDAEAALKEKEESYHLLEEELAPLRRVREQFQEKQRQSAAESERIKTELAQATADHLKSESELREQLAATKLAGTQTEAALRKSEDHAVALDAQLSTLRDEHRNLRELQQQTAAELERSKAELIQASAERAKSESDLGEQLKAARLATGNTELALKEKEANCRTLEEDLSAQRQAHSQLQQQTAADLQKLKGELKQQASERTHLETECKNLADTKAALNLELSQLRASLAASEALTLDAENRIKDGLASLTSLTGELEKERESRQKSELRANSLSKYLRGLHGDLDKELAKESA